MKIALVGKCFMCQKHKPASEFYRSNRRDNGLSSMCKDCDKIRCKGRNRKQYMRDYKKNSGHKLKAKWMVKYAVKKGELVRGVCVVCGKEKVDGHHEDYDKPLDVIWLCHQHHMERHRNSHHE